MLDSFSADVGFGHSPLDVAGSLVRACLEDALIDVDGPVVQRVSSPEGSSVEHAAAKSHAPGPMRSDSPKIGIGGAVYAKAVREVSASAQENCRIQEPHPEPGPSDRVPAPPKVRGEAPPSGWHNLENRLYAPRAPAAPGRERRYVRPITNNVAAIPSPIAPSPGAASSNQAPSASPLDCAEQSRNEMTLLTIATEEPRQAEEKMVSDIMPSMSSLGSLSPFRGSHVASKEVLPAALGTGEVLRGALEGAAKGKLPLIRNASCASQQNSADRIQNDMTLPPLHRASPRADNKSSAVQDGESLPPIISERREIRIRETPLYLRMQRHYEEQQQKILNDAQERRRADVAGLMVSASPAPQSRKIRRQPSMKKPRGLRRKRVQKKRPDGSGVTSEMGQPSREDATCDTLVAHPPTATSSEAQGERLSEGRAEIKKPVRPRNKGKGQRRAEDPRKKRHIKQNATEQKQTHHKDKIDDDIDDCSPPVASLIQDNEAEAEDVSLSGDQENSTTQVRDSEFESPLPSERHEETDTHGPQESDEKVAKEDDNFEEAAEEEPVNTLEEALDKGVDHKLEEVVDGPPEDPGNGSASQLDLDQLEIEAASMEIEAASFEKTSADEDKLST